MIPSSKPLKSLSRLVQIPSLAIGTWSWGDKKIWGDGSPEAQEKVEEAFKRLLDTSESIFLDTAEAYGEGQSEVIIGNLLKKYSEHPNINNVVVATKFLPYPWKLSYPSSLLSALEASLKRLQLKQVDLYQIHGPIHLRSIETVAKALAEAVKLGLTKTVGVSNYSLAETEKMLKALKKYDIPLASNQIEFSLLRRLPETSGLVEFCKANDIAVLAYSPLAMGRLTGKYSHENPPPSGRRFSDYPMKELEPLLSVMRTLAEKHDTTVSAIALNYLMLKGAVPLVGCKDAGQVDSNFRSLNWALTPEDLVTLEGHAKVGTTTWFWQHG